MMPHQNARRRGSNADTSGTAYEQYSLVGEWARRMFFLGPLKPPASLDDKEFSRRPVNETPPTDQVNLEIRQRASAFLCAHWGETRTIDVCHGNPLL